MNDHRIRLLLIAVIFLAALVGVIVCVIVGKDTGTGFGGLLGVLSTMGPALIDAGTVHVRSSVQDTPPRS